MMTDEIPDEYDYKRVVAIKPDSVSRQEWIAHLCQIMPHRADQIRREAMENVGKTPKVYQTYLEDQPINILIAWED